MDCCQRLLNQSSCLSPRLQSRPSDFESEAGTYFHNGGFGVISGNKDAFHQKNAPGSLVRAVRPLPMRLVTVRKSLDSGAQSLINEYVSKAEGILQSLTDLGSEIVVKRCDVVAQTEAEGERVQKAIAARDWVILLDERGRDVTSEQLATTIAEAGDTGASALVFCIGGPYGHGSQVRKRANLSIKLSSMTLNHQVAIIVLLEQIYRSWTILRGEKYHH